MEAPPRAQRAGVLIPGPRLPAPLRAPGRPQWMQAALASAAAVLSAGWGSWATPSWAPCLGLAAFCGAAGCCCGLGWGLLLGSWLHQLTQGAPKRLLSALALALARTLSQQGGGVGPESRQELSRAYARSSARPAHLPGR